MRHENGIPYANFYVCKIDISETYYLFHSKAPLTQVNDMKKERETARMDLSRFLYN